MHAVAPHKNLFIFFLLQIFRIRRTSYPIFYLPNALFPAPLLLIFALPPPKNPIRAKRYFSIRAPRIGGVCGLEFHSSRAFCSLSAFSSARAMSSSLRLRSPGVFFPLFFAPNRVIGIVRRQAAVFADIIESFAFDLFPSPAAFLTNFGEFFSKNTVVMQIVKSLYACLFLYSFANFEP